MRRMGTLRRKAGSVFLAHTLALWVMLPLSIFAGSVLGKSSSHLLTSVLPALLLLVAVPSAALVWADGRFEPRRGSQVLFFTSVLGLHLLAVGLGVLANVHVLSPGSLAVFVLMEGLWLPAALWILSSRKSDAGRWGE